MRSTCVGAECREGAGLVDGGGRGVCTLTGRGMVRVWAGPAALLGLDRERDVASGRRGLQMIISRLR